MGEDLGTCGTGRGDKAGHAQEGVHRFRVTGQRHVDARLSQAFGIGRSLIFQRVQTRGLDEGRSQSREVVALDR